MVSIVCTNYNKGKWIEDAIQGFLNQVVNFEYEILIIDDKSTDNSPAIIRQYQEKYPHKIRNFFNTDNLGITKTWIKICKEAKGKYIARCDGDDYWTDAHKLQKQVDLLEKTSDSKWSNTDFDILSTPTGMLSESGFETGVVQKVNSYRDMLVTRGFTMSSTWLIERKLINEVNMLIDIEAVDDTFNIQLELFRRTRLVYLPESTTVYRTDYESDSKPNDFRAVSLRSNRLLDTQVEYIDKYNDVDYKDILKRSLYELNSVYLSTISLGNEIQQQKQSIKELQINIDKLTHELKQIETSSRYRLGNAIIYPLDFARGLLNKRRQKGSTVGNDVSESQK